MTLFKKSIAVMAVATLSITSLANAAVTTVYKSTGANGEVKYSQFPPKSGTYETLEMRSDGRQNTPGDMAAPPVDPNAQQNSQVAQLQQQVQDLEKRENAQRCQTLRNNLANLNIGGRIYEMDAQGQRVYLNDQEINTRRARIQETINQHCAGV